MLKYIILHGSFGSCDGNRFPRLKNNLENENKNVIVPQMPIGIDNQNFDNRSKTLNNIGIDDTTVFIAHSIAPIFVCKYLVKNKIKVKKLIFVCGFNNYFSGDNKYDSVNKTMYTDDYGNVKNYCNDIVCYYTDNDPYIPFNFEKEFANNIANKKYIIKNGGHINSESGFLEFHYILKEI